ncbi:SIS domain-containing protein [Acidothermaceae bacterium B102]|nr:SIS domain-containing protein [Acidothermaceae bacterium B102]
MTKSPFELDMDDQAAALRAFGDAPPPADVVDAVAQPYDRIVLTGMGSSHSAALPTWRALTASGHPVWWVDTGQLLDTPELVTPGTLLVVTSQSGASAEIAALFDPESGIGPARVVAVTNNPDSVLARGAAAVLPLRSGDEATVSTKSYLNSLAAHQQLLAAFGVAVASASVSDAAKAVEHFVAPQEAVTIARHLADADNARLAFVGSRDHAATALYAGLIVKEAAKIPAEGFIGGQFRHGPFELAGPGLAVVVLGVFADDPNSSLRDLAADLVRAGSQVLLVGDVSIPGAMSVVLDQSGTLTELSIGALVTQHLAVEIAKARGIEPGAFAFGAKVTTTR